MFLSRSESLSSHLTSFDAQLSDSLMKRGLISTPEDLTSHSRTPETITTTNSESPTQLEHLTDSPRDEDTTCPSRDNCAAVSARVNNDVTPRDQLSADGPYSPADLEHEVEAVIGGVVGDCEIQSEITERVVHRMQTSQSFRRSAVNGGVVRSCIIQIEVNLLT